MANEYTIAPGQTIYWVHNEGNKVVITFMSSPDKPWIRVTPRIAFKMAWHVFKYAAKGWFGGLRS